MSLSDTRTYSRRRTTALAILLAFLASLLVVSTALAEESSPDFQLQGDVEADDDSDFVDWNNFLERGANGDVTPIADPPTQTGYIAVGASADYILPDTSTYQGGGSKDINPIEEWRCTTRNNVNNKVDILNAYTVAQRNDDGDLVVYFGAEIRESEGNSNIGLWLLQDDTVGCEGRGGFDGSHVDGDIFVVSAFTDGGTTANVNVYEWEQGSLQPRGEFADATCVDGTLGEDQEACAIANSASVETDWNSPDKSGDLNAELEPNTFFEGGINISQVLGSNGDEPCITQFLTNTRSSQSLNAQLFDYTIGDLNVCGNLTIVKETDPAGVDRDFGFEIEGPSFEVAEPFTLNAGDPEPDPEEQVPDRITFNDITAGDYTITEDVPDGWDLIEIACDNGATVDLAEGSVVVGVGLEANVTCTFTNQLRHSIVVEKQDENEDPLGGAEFALHAHDTDADDPDDADEAVGGKIADIGAEHDHLFCIDNLVPGRYWVVEEDAPEGFDGDDPQFVDTSDTRSCEDRFTGEGDDRALVGDADVIFTNVSLPGEVVISKTDDAGNELEGVTFALFEVNLDNLEKVPGSEVSGLNCTTDDDGTCTIEDVPHGEYFIDETDLPDQYAKDGELPKLIEVDRDETVLLSFVNPRLHALATIVCHEGTNTLAESRYHNGDATDTRQSVTYQDLLDLFEGDATEADAAQELLCDLALDGFKGLGHGNKTTTTDVGSQAHE